jgi:hypothetical protein
MPHQYWRTRMDINRHPCWIDENKRYSLREILDRLELTDEDLLLCKQHREYAEKLDDMFDYGTRAFGVNINTTIRKNT